MSERVVRSLPTRSRVPMTSVERLALAIVAREGPLPLPSLITRVARTLYAEAVRGGGWAAEVGLLGPAAFVPEVSRELAEADGALWRIDAGEEAG